MEKQKGNEWEQKKYDKEELLHEDRHFWGIWKCAKLYKKAAEKYEEKICVNKKYFHG